MRIEFFKHNIAKEDKENVINVLNSIFLTTGEAVNEFEERFSRCLKTKHTVGLTSCTAALHLALLTDNIGDGDEVITTPLSFVATANSILMSGAKPVFVDVEPNTGNINANLIKCAITKRTKAIMPVHLYGQMCDMIKIKALASKYNLKIIEDCAHCIEGERDGIRPGKLSDAACFSFYATKSITSGEGGAITTNSAKRANYLKMLRLHGMDKSAADRYTKKYKHWDMYVLGWKYNMDNIQASLLLGQLSRIDELWKKRDKIYRKYEDAFKEIRAIKITERLPNAKHASHIFTIFVSEKNRDSIFASLQKKGIGIAVNYRPIHLLKYYRDRFGFKEKDYPFAERIGASTISLPLYPLLNGAEIDYVISSVKKAV